MKLAPVQSVAQLETKAKKDARYGQAAKSAAKNLGYEGEGEGDLYEVLAFLRELDEDEVVEEMNFCL